MGLFRLINRLEERILSAVSQQVQTIQLGLKAAKDNPNIEIEIVGKNLKVNTNTGKHNNSYATECFVSVFKILSLLSLNHRYLYYHESWIRGAIRVA